MGVSQEKTVTQLVIENTYVARILSKYGINVCGQEDLTLFSACEINNLNYDEISQEILNFTQYPLPNANIENWELSKILHYVIEHHHQYTRDALIIIKDVSEKVLKKHYNNYPELARIYQLIHQSQIELLPHMMKEEKLLFPAIESLIEADKKNRSQPGLKANAIDKPIFILELEHKEAEDTFIEIRDLTHDYEVPDWACDSFRVLFILLEELEADLIYHMKIENEVLFPKAYELEKKLMNS